MKRGLIVALVIFVLLLGTAGCAIERPEIRPDSSESTREDDKNGRDAQDVEDTKDVQEVHYNYDKILDGDLSEFAGIWRNNNNETRTLKADGTTGDEITENGVTYKEIAYGFEKAREGWYSWSMALENYDGPSGYGVMLYPVGVEVVMIPGGEVVETDTTKVRIFMGQGFPPADEAGDEIFYMD